MKGGSGSIHSLASFHCFSYKHLFHNGAFDMANAYSGFCQKAQNLLQVKRPDLVHTSPAVVKIFLKELQIVF